MKFSIYFTGFTLLLYLTCMPMSFAQHQQNHESQSNQKCQHESSKMEQNHNGCCWMAVHFINDKDELDKCLKNSNDGNCWAPNHKGVNWDKKNCLFCDRGWHDQSWHNKGHDCSSECNSMGKEHHLSWHIHSLADKDNCPLCREKKHNKSWHDSLDWQCRNYGWQKNGSFHCCWDEHKLWDPENCELCKNKMHDKSWHKSIATHCDMIGNFKPGPDASKSKGCNHGGSGKNKSGSQKRCSEHSK